MPEEIEGQTPTPQPEGQAPEGQQPEQGSAEQAPKLVDVNARDDQGHQLWFPREAMTQTREEAARYRRLYQEAKQALEAHAQPADKQDKKEKPDPAKDQESDIASRLAQLEARERELVIENAILAAAARRTDERGAFINPAEAVKLLDRTNVQLHDDGTVKGVEDALKALATQSPHLLVQDGKRPPKIDPTNPGGGSPGTPQIVKDIQARMSGQTNPFGGGGVVLPEE